MATDQIEKMYAAQLEAQKAQLQQDYDSADARLVASMQQAQKAADSALKRTAVESQKAVVDTNQLHDAVGLSSGARAQARIAQENQLQADMTAIRQDQLEADAEAQRERDLLAKEFMNAIRQAQAENDMAKAEALYAQAQKEEDRLLKKQETAAQLLAGAGDHSRAGQLYGLSAAEVAKLDKAAAASAASGSSGSSGSSGGSGTNYDLAAAKLLAEETGDYTMLGQLYGLSQEQIDALNGKTPDDEPDEGSGGGGGSGGNGGTTGGMTYDEYVAKKNQAISHGETLSSDRADAFIQRFSGYLDMGYSDYEVKGMLEDALENTSDTFGLTYEDIWIINDHFGLGLEKRVRK